MVPRFVDPQLTGPVRMCIGCRERAAKRELLRVTLGADDDGAAVVPDPDGTAPGRGAHLHPTPECLTLAERRRAFARALRYEGGGPLGLDAVRTCLSPVTDRVLDGPVDRANTVNT